MTIRTFTQEIDAYGLRFEPIIGEVYYVYEKKDNERFVSLIRPSEWGKGYEFKHIHSARFCADESWEKVE